MAEDVVERGSSPSPTWPAAVSARSVAALAAPVREATVLGTFRHAVYLGVDDGVVLPLVAAGGLRLPTALWLARPAPVGWGVQPGDRVRVGAGAVRLPAVTVHAVRVWTPEVVPVAEPGARLPLPVGASPLRQVAHDLSRAALAGHGVPGLVQGLVGGGPGLTPSGDDVLCGVLLGLRFRGCPEAVARVWSEVAPRLTTTTLLSAALLREAAEGYAVPAVVRLTAALVEGHQHEVERRLAEVLAIGHTSGSDLLAGLAGALDAPVSAPEKVAGPEKVERASDVAVTNEVDQCPTTASSTFFGRARRGAGATTGGGP